MSGCCHLRVSWVTGRRQLGLVEPFPPQALLHALFVCLHLLAPWGSTEARPKTANLAGWWRCREHQCPGRGHLGASEVSAVYAGSSAHAWDWVCSKHAGTEKAGPTALPHPAYSNVNRAYDVLKKLTPKACGGPRLEEQACRRRSASACPDSQLPATLTALNLALAFVQLLIDGKWEDAAGGKTFEDLDPRTGEERGRQGDCNRQTKPATCRRPAVSLHHISSPAHCQERSLWMWRRRRLRMWTAQCGPPRR